MRTGVLAKVDLMVVDHGSCARMHGKHDGPGQLAYRGSYSGQGLGGGIRLTMHGQEKVGAGLERELCQNLGALASERPNQVGHVEHHVADLMHPVPDAFVLEVLDGESRGAKQRVAHAVGQGRG